MAREAMDEHLKGLLPFSGVIEQNKYVPKDGFFGE